jgi:hypothetical protein
MKNKPIINICMALILLGIYVLVAYYGKLDKLTYGIMAAILSAAAYFFYKFIIDITE